MILQGNFDLILWKRIYGIESEVFIFGDNQEIYLDNRFLL